jgi:hypothetical protein
MDGTLAVALSQYDFEKQWGEGTIFDKFLIILTLSAASAPYFNMEPTNTKELSESLMISSLSDLMDSYSAHIVFDGEGLEPKVLDNRTRLEPIPESSEPIDDSPEPVAMRTSPLKFSTAKKTPRKQSHSEVEKPTPTRTS